MKIKKENFLIQTKYSDLVLDAGNVDRYFLGFGGELYLSAEEINNYDSRIIGGIKDFTQKNHLPLRLHGPIAKIDYSQIQSTIPLMQSLYANTIKLCKILGINHIVTHAEFDYSIDFPVNKQLENAVSLWHVLCDDLSVNNIYINIENHCEIKPDHLIMLLEKINSPHFGMCVDIGHFNAFSDLGTKKCLAKYPIGSIKEVHLADNEGDDDTHLSLGEGNIDFASFFKILEKRSEDCVFILEPRNIAEAKKSLSFLRKEGFLVE